MMGCSSPYRLLTSRRIRADVSSTLRNVTSSCSHDGLLLYSWFAHLTSLLVFYMHKLCNDGPRLGAEGRLRRPYVGYTALLMCGNKHQAWLVAGVPGLLQTDICALRRVLCLHACAWQGLGHRKGRAGKYWCRSILEIQAVGDSKLGNAHGPNLCQYDRVD
jgi:hypothetical protein